MAFPLTYESMPGKNTHQCPLLGIKENWSLFKRFLDSIQLLILPVFSSVLTFALKIVRGGCQNLREAGI